MEGDSQKDIVNAFVRAVLARKKKNKADSKRTPTYSDLGFASQWTRTLHKLCLKKGCPVRITRNINVDLGIGNGTIGTYVGCIYSEKQKYLLVDVPT